MLNILKKLRFLLLLITLGIIIRYVDPKVTKDGFLSTNEIADHYIFIDWFFSSCFIGIYNYILIKNQTRKNK